MAGSGGFNIPEFPSNLSKKGNVFFKHISQVKVLC